MKISVKPLVADFVPFDLFLKHTRMVQANIAMHDGYCSRREFNDVAADFLDAVERFRRDHCPVATGGEQWDRHRQ